MSLSLNCGESGDRVNLGRMLIVISVPTPMPDVLSSRYSRRKDEPRAHVNKQSRNLKSGRGVLDRLDIFERILDRINRGETFQGMAIKYSTDALGDMGKVHRKAWWLLREERLMSPSSFASLISSKMHWIKI